MICQIKSLIYKPLKLLYKRIKSFLIVKSVRKFKYKNIKKEQLKWLEASELFLYVINAPINKHIQCSILEKEIHLIDHNVSGCCGAIIPFGSLLTDASIEDIYHSIYKNC